MTSKLGIQGLWAIGTAAALLLLATSATAETQRIGEEFLDPPEAPAAPGETAPSEPPDEKEAAGYLPGYREVPSVGLSPHAPQLTPSLPGAFTPSFGAPTKPSGFRFSFNGYLQVPVRVGIGHRDRALEGQRSTTLHADPVVPGAAFGWFDHTNTVPTPWAQLNFIYGNDVVKATTIIGAWTIGQADSASGYFIVPAHLWFSDAFLTFTPDVAPLGLRVNVGVFPERYGAMAKYHNGAYGVPLIGQIQGVGATGTVELPFEGGIDMRVEAGFKGDFNKPPVGIIQDPSNDFAREEEGSTYAAHAHAGASYGAVTPTLHYIRAFSQDDRGDEKFEFDRPLTPENEALKQLDGTLDIIGADVRVDAARFGYFYLGAAHVEGENTASVSNLVQVLYTGSGRDFMERFWGYQSNGTGTINLVGAEYTLSLGTLLRHPYEFWGEGPDLTVSLFAIGADVGSPVPEFDDQQMLKYGTEVVYSFSKHVAAATRLDHVVPNLDNSSESFGVITPKLIFRTDWVTREALTLQYSGYVFGDDTVVNGDNRLVNTNSDNPDQHMIALLGTMWW